MPVIKSAKKKARQALKREERNKGVRTQVKTFIKKVTTLSKTNNEEAVKLLPIAYKVLDTAAKKHLIHKNNAARKKSLLARSVKAGAGMKTVVKEKAPKAAKAAK
jgi:small subunit ribosomal protein S20